MAVIMVSIMHSQPLLLRGDAVDRRLGQCRSAHFNVIMMRRMETEFIMKIFA